MEPDGRVRWILHIKMIFDGYGLTSVDVAAGILESSGHDPVELVFFERGGSYHFPKRIARARDLRR